MSGFVRFVDDDWAWSSSMTYTLFDFLVERLPSGQLKSDLTELRDNNVLMLDLRDPSNDLIVQTIVDDLPNYLDSLDSDLRSALLPGFTELLRLASAQRAYNRTADE